MKMENNLYVKNKRSFLSSRFARTADDLQQAFELRHSIFCQKNVEPNFQYAQEYDEYDEYCHHLLLESQEEGIIGTCRLLPQDQSPIGFYSNKQFSVSELLERQKKFQFLEIGRICISEKYRTGTAVGLLWQSIWNYFREGRYDVMIGCASFNGVNPKIHAGALAFLKKNYSAPKEWNVLAKKNSREITSIDIDSREASKLLPPLVKSYIRLGAYVSNTVSIDFDFNTTDIFVALHRDRINPRYFGRFGSPNR